MGFWIKFLFVLIFGFAGFSVHAQVQNENNYLSIPDFPVHRVTPEKTTVSSSSGNIEIKKEIPKLRTVSQSEQKPQVQQQIIDKQQNKQTETESPERIAENNSIQTASEPKKNENTNVYENTETKNNLNQTNTTPDTIVSKINKINEKDQPLAVKNGFEKTNLAKETGNDFLRTFSSLSIVLLLIFVFAWIYARVKGINPTAILTGKFSEKDMNRFNVLSTSTLGQGKDIHLVEINGKQLVIGSTSNNINLLTEIPPEEIKKLKEKKQAWHHDENQNYEYAEHIEPEDLESIELPEEDEFYYGPYESNEDTENSDPEFYSFKYSDVYKDYLNKQDEKKDSKG